MRDMNYEELLKEEYNAQHALLEQYRKELRDLENHTGIATLMSKTEITYSIGQLKEAIKSKEKYLNALETCE